MSPRIYKWNYRKSRPSTLSQHLTFFQLLFESKLLYFTLDTTLLTYNFLLLYSKESVRARWFALSHTIYEISSAQFTSWSYRLIQLLDQYTVLRHIRKLLYQFRHVFFVHTIGINCFEQSFHSSIEYASLFVCEIIDHFYFANVISIPH